MKDEILGSDDEDGDSDGSDDESEEATGGTFRPYLIICTYVS